MPHLDTHTHPVSCISKEGKKRRRIRKEEGETHFVVFGLLVFYLRACYLSLEILYSLVHCWLSILRKFSLLGFSQGILLLSLWLCFYQ